MTAAGKARGIIFRGDMVRAILAGTKTQTRRVVKPQPIRDPYNGCDGDLVIWGRTVQRLAPSPSGDSRSKITVPVPCPYGVPGDRLWVRETWCPGRGLAFVASPEILMAPAGAALAPGVIYSADGASLPPGTKWRSSRFMPRWASRLTLVVEAVRVERLSAITDEDAVAEGFVGHASANVDGAVLSVEPGEQYLAAFRAMHNLAADADPWLWVVTFKKEPANG